MRRILILIGAVMQLIIRMPALAREIYYPNDSFYHPVKINEYLIPYNSPRYGLVWYIMFRSPTGIVCVFNPPQYSNLICEGKFAYKGRLPIITPGALLQSLTSMNQTFWMDRVTLTGMAPAKYKRGEFYSIDTFGRVPKMLPIGSKIVVPMSGVKDLKTNKFSHPTTVCIADEDKMLACRNSYRHGFIVSAVNGVYF